MFPWNLTQKRRLPLNRPARTQVLSDVLRVKATLLPQQGSAPLPMRAALTKTTWWPAGFSISASHHLWAWRDAADGRL